MNTKILVSDDEEIWRENVIGDALRKSGYDVRTSSTIRDTVDVLNREFFHVATIDLSFSEDHSIAEGKEIMQLLKRLDEGTKAIVLTGYGTVDVAVEALREHDVFHFLQKGEQFEDKLFANIVEDAAEQARTSLMNRRLSFSAEEILSGLRVRDVASRLEEKESQIVWMVKNILGNAMPIVLSTEKGGLVKTDSGTIFQRALWSRMFGKAVRVVLGPATAVEEYSLAASIIGRCSSENKKTIGVLLEENDLDFGDFLRFKC